MNQPQPLSATELREVIAIVREQSPNAPFEEMLRQAILLRDFLTGKPATEIIAPPAAPPPKAATPRATIPTPPKVHLRSSKHWTDSERVFTGQLMQRGVHMSEIVRLTGRTRTAIYEQYRLGKFPEMPFTPGVFELLEDGIATETGR